MEKEQLRAIIIKCILKYAEEYKTTIFKALNECSVSSYLFLFRTRGCSISKHEYSEHFFDFVLGDDFSFTDTEYQYACIYYGSHAETEPPKVEVIEMFRQAIEEHRAENKRLTEVTKDIRRNEQSCSLSNTLEKIEDYIKYCHEVCSYDSEILLYIRLYHMGFVDGKRSERARRKNAARHIA
ncbi:MAG: hypothetical protein ACI38A_05245 [Candidatus Ornithomonoglobus sp.]